MDEPCSFVVMVGSRTVDESCSFVVVLGSRTVDAGGQRGWSVAGGDPTRTALLEQRLRVADQTLRRADQEVRIPLFNHVHLHVAARSVCQSAVPIIDRFLSFLLEVQFRLGLRLRVADQTLRWADQDVRIVNHCLPIQSLYVVEDPFADEQLFTVFFHFCSFL